MIAIANCSEGWAIGKDGHLICKIPEDMKRFHDLTLGKTVVMGHNTLRSLPGMLPLPGRHNIVILGPNSPIESEPVNAPRPAGTSLTLVYSVEDVLWFTENTPKDDVFVIGGERVYRDLLPYCDKCYITLNSADAEDADTFFPNLDEMPEWRQTHQEPVKTYEDIIYEFTEYERIAE